MGNAILHMTLPEVCNISRTTRHQRGPYRAAKFRSCVLVNPLTKITGDANLTGVVEASSEANWVSCSIAAYTRRKINRKVEFDGHHVCGVELYITIVRQTPGTRETE